MARRKYIVCLYLLVAALVSIAGVLTYTQSSAKLSDSQSFIPTFMLKDGSTDRMVTEKDLSGKPYAVAFGFTRCPDPTICPTILARMSQWEKNWGNKMHFVFVTVDPEVDTPTVLSDYVGAFSSNIMPLSGSVTQVQAALDSYNVYAEKVPLSIGMTHHENEDNTMNHEGVVNYTMDHHTPIFLFDGDGRFYKFIYLDDDRATATQKLNGLFT